MARRDAARWIPGPRCSHIVLLSALLAVAGCASNYAAPIEQKPALPKAGRAAPASMPRVAHGTSVDRNQPTPAVHVVASGDKLLTIAWRYGLDVRDLVRWNQISNPDLIVVGQNLRLRPAAPPEPPPSSSPRAPSVVSAGPAATTASGLASRAPAPISKPAARISMAPITPDAPALRGAAAVPTDSAPNLASNKAGVRWMWPAQGKVSAVDGGSVTKGIDISGSRGQAVKAAAGGKVVYSGSGLRGYGELIIVQHNDTFLSAYAHNEARLVQEGRHVDAGETIARMGNSDTTNVMLHFEIRRNGKAVDPLQYLPNR